MKIKQISPFIIVFYNIKKERKAMLSALWYYCFTVIEISPVEADYTNYMLTVMYVTDATNNATPTKAQDISSDNLAGTVIFGKAVLFPKTEKLLTEESSFTLTQAGECYITGVSSGEWKVMNGNKLVTTVNVEDGTNMFTFTANNAGTYTLTPAN